MSQPLTSEITKQIDDILALVLIDENSTKAIFQAVFVNPALTRGIALNGSTNNLVSQVRSGLTRYGTVECDDPSNPGQKMEVEALWLLLEHIKTLVGANHGKKIESLRKYFMPSTNPHSPQNNPVLDILNRSKKISNPDQRLRIRREVNFPLYCFLLDEKEEYVSSSRLKELLGLPDDTFDMLEAHWTALDQLQIDPEGNYLITTEGRKNILEAFDSDSHDYHISLPIPYFEPSMTGIEYCQYMNEIRTPRGNFARANFTALERCFTSGKNKMLTVEPVQNKGNSPEISIVKAGDKPLFILLIGQSATAITENQFRGTYVYHLTSVASRYNHIPALILGTSLLDPRLGREFHEAQPWVSHMWELSAISFFRQLDSVLKENPTKRDEIAKNLDAILKDQGVLSLSSTQAIRNLKERVNIPSD